MGPLTRRLRGATDRQHAAGIHTDCDRTACEWWTSRPEWQRRAFDATGGRRWAAVKEIGA